MSRKKGILKGIWERETKKLETFLYENELYENAEQFSPFHFRIKGKQTVDIWAGSRKYFIHGMARSAIYGDLNELKDYLI